MTIPQLVGLHLAIFSGVAAMTLAILVGRGACSRFPARLFRFSNSFKMHTSPRMIPASSAAARLFPGRTRPMADFLNAAGSTWKRTAYVVLLLGGGALAGAEARAESAWPSFQNGGAVSLSADLPTKWDAATSVAWHQDLVGYGQSSPVVWKGQVYITSVSGANKETYHVVAYSLKEGTKLWQYDVANPSPQESTSYVSKAAPTPVADDKGLVCFFEGGIVAGLTHGGEKRWERNLVTEFGAIDSRHGVSASVEQNADLAFLWVERTTEPYVLAVNKNTGETTWKVAGIGKTSWASPRLVPVAEGESHLVLSAIGFLVGLDPKTGERLWTFDQIAGNSTPTPVPAGNGKFLIGATTGQGESGGGNPPDSNGMVAIGRDANGQWAAQWIWHAKRATSSFGSPILAEGNAYFVNRSGVLYCLDQETGEEHYAQRAGESVWATPLATKGHVLLFGKGGTVSAVATGKTFEKLGESIAWEGAGAAPAEGRGGPPGASGPVLYGAAFVDGSLLLRRGDQLICVRTK
jgi:outer membrane protein assembly factor BamB